MIRYLKSNRKVLINQCRSISLLSGGASISTNNHVNRKAIDILNVSKAEESKTPPSGHNWSSRILKAAVKAQIVENAKRSAAKKPIIFPTTKNSNIKKPLKINGGDKSPKPKQNGSNDELLERYETNQVLDEFRRNETVLLHARKSGMTAKMFNDLVLSFRKICLASSSNSPDLYQVLCEANKIANNVTEIYPYFESHARKTYPHLDCLEDLREISNLTEPANWYIEARELKRKIVYHAGPTNSGKTYSALQDFMASSSGIYCGPLKLLANEVFTKANQANARCDLVTGEERRFATGDESQPAEHIACTVEMANLDKDYECAVIDEIQMIGDAQRGWAWTRAFLGLKAKTIHICGDRSALDLIKRLSKVTGDDLEVRTYERLTPLSIMDKAVENFDRVEPGDCIVCFNKQDIFSVVSELEKRGHEVAVIYGSMPPQVKLSQAARFNDPNDKCKLLVATDAVGMGLNLNIRRVVFYSLKKPQIVERTPNPASSLLPAGLVQSSTDITHITTSQALQIAGRAGRFNTHFKDGFVSTFNKSDLPTLKEILKRPLEKTDKAGLHPTPEQIELFGFYLPNYSLSDLIRVFASLCSIDERQYFLSAFDDVAYLASLIDHIPLKLKAKYTFATSPIGEKQTFACTCFVKFVRFYSNNEAVSADTLRKMLGCWPLRVPANLGDVAHLECVYDVLDLYLWLAYRFPEIFVDRERCRLMRDELENVIYKGVKNISFLNQNQGPDEEAPSSLKTKFR